MARGADGHDRRMARQRRPATARQRTGHLAGTGTAASGAVQPPALPCQGAAQTTGDGPGADARNPRGQCREFPRTPGVPARQCGRTGRRTLPVSCGWASPSSARTAKPFSPPHKSEKATRSTSRSPTAASRAPFNTPKRNDPRHEREHPFPDRVLRAVPQVHARAGGTRAPARCTRQRAVHPCGRQGGHRGLRRTWQDRARLFRRTAYESLLGRIRHGRKYAPAFLGDTRRGFPLRRPDFGRHPAVIPCRNDTYGTPGSL